MKFGTDIGEGRYRFMKYLELVNHYHFQVMLYTISNFTYMHSDPVPFTFSAVELLGM